MNALLTLPLWFAFWWFQASNFWLIPLLFLEVVLHWRAKGVQ